MKHICTLLFVVVCFGAMAQTPQNTPPSHLPGMQVSYNAMPYREHTLLLSKAEYAKKVAAKTTSGGPGYIFDTSRWDHLVDSTWGAGMSDTAKMEQFNFFWKNMDSIYACFMNLPPYNWDSIVTAIDTQIMHGVSRGRFAAIINNFMTYINDGHSRFKDITVNYPSMVYAGQPLFRGESGKFGACVTTLYDTLALVYSAHTGHPFGLQPGDIILGYNSIPWTTLVKTILYKQLPNSVYLGSTDAATMHRYIQAAGENWYLFDTINIKKCDGSIVNLPTSLMTGVFYQDFCTEQMPVAGIHNTTYTEYFSSGIEISAGVINGKRIGYVYMYDCSDAGGTNLLNAVKRLVEDSLVNGLILDVRTNYGGGFNAYIPTFLYLNSGDVSWVGYGDRYDANRMHLYNSGLPAWYDLADTDPGYFPHPIAVICGPNAVSAGDFFPMLFKHDPHVKVFGKSTAGAYGASTSITLPYPGFTAGRQIANFFEVGAATSYLTHVEVPVDSNVWFNKDSVCAGIDNVVSIAVQWIEGYTAGINAPEHRQIDFSIYPNPANNHINMAITSPANETVNIQLCNMMGAMVKDMQYTAAAGSNTLQMNIADLHLPAGSYYIVLQGNDGYRSVKKLAIVH